MADLAQGPYIIGYGWLPSRQRVIHRSRCGTSGSRRAIALSRGRGACETSQVPAWTVSTCGCGSGILDLRRWTAWARTWLRSDSTVTRTSDPAPRSRRAGIRYGSYLRDRGPLVSVRPPVSRFPGSVSGPCFGLADSRRSPALAPATPQRLVTARCLHRYYAGVRLLRAVHHRLRLAAFPTRSHRLPARTTRTSQVPAWGIRACLGSQTPRSPLRLAIAAHPMLPSTMRRASALRTISDAQYPAHTHRYRRFTGTLTGTAARLAVNRGSAHPSFQGTFTLTPPPVSLAHPHLDRSPPPLLDDPAEVEDARDQRIPRQGLMGLEQRQTRRRRSLIPSAIRMRRRQLNPVLDMRWSALATAAATDAGRSA